MKDEKDFYIEALQARLTEVHKTLAPLVDDDNRPVEALARHAVSRLVEAEALLRECHAAIFADSWALDITHRVMTFLTAPPPPDSTAEGT